MRLVGSYGLLLHKLEAQQYRICFKWISEGATDVEIVDCH
jgi:plasmid maintenance system killer protein